MTVVTATIGTHAATRGGRYLERAALGLIAAFLAVGVHRVFVTNINWDEFYYLSFVHLFLSGDLTLPLQTLHVRLFAWLPWVSENEVWQIFAARGVVWLAGLLSAWLIFRIAGRFCGRLGALFAVVLYLSFSYVMDHGTSFRADPFCALLFLLAAHLLVDKSAWPYTGPAAAVAMAAAVMFSLKSVFYLPTVAVLLAAPLLVPPGRFEGLRRSAVFAVWFLAALAGLFTWHKLGLAPALPADAGAYAAAAGRKTIGFDRLLPAWPFVARALADNPLVWIFVVCGLWTAGQRLVAADERVNAVMALSFAVPLLSLLVYRNAFPYFFVFLMPAAVIPAAIAVDRLAARALAPGGGAAFAALTATLTLAGAGYALNYAQKLPDQTVAQAETVRLVHAMFDEPVPYIDRNSMIASFPKVGFFMSTWGLESYRAAGQPIMADLLARHAPPLLLANAPALDISRFVEADQKTSSYSLFQEDIDVLKENYIHHWGAVYVAGKRLLLEAGDGPRTFQVLIPGTYTLEAKRTVAIDGVDHAPGAFVALGRGSHQITTLDDGTLPVTLRWGRDLIRPAQAPSPQPIYTSF